MNKLAHIAFLLLCLSATAWFAQQLLVERSAVESTLLSPSSNASQGQSADVASESKHSGQVANSSTVNQSEELETAAVLMKIKTRLQQTDFAGAVELFDVGYDEFNAEQVSAIEAVFYQQTEQYLNNQQWSLAQALAKEYLAYFQQALAYWQLARAQAQQGDFQLAVTNGINAYSMGVDQAQQQQLQQFTVNTALQYSRQRSELNDFSNPLQLLLELYSRFPDDPALSFQIAKLSIASGQMVNAREYLSNLTYSNNDYQQAAQQLLTAIDEQQLQQQSRQSPQQSQQPQQQRQEQTAALPPVVESTKGRSASVEPLPDNAVSVPLIVAGSSYLVEVSINQRPVTLLLDTGASITALDERLIRRLGLDRTGRRVRLSTANGSRTSNIYLAETLSMQKVVLNNARVVAVDLGREARIDGLLGTDVLQRFIYQIDNANNRLILRQR